MIDKALGLALVFNGAIYNYRELRQELKSLGYYFTSDSDTEVLFKAYHAWGKDCIPRLNGIFAFAIWEMETEKLILVRDRLGIKPLYYTNTSRSFRFASTLPALLEFGDINTAIDPHALHYYLNFHVVPEPLTILSGVKKLLPGYVMTIYPNGKTEQYNYWHLQFDDDGAEHTHEENEWLMATHKALMMATERQLAADSQ